MSTASSTARAWARREGGEVKDARAERRAVLAELAGRAKGGDRAAACELCARLKDPLFAFCLSRVRNRSDAEDICQEVLVAVVADLDRLKDPKAVLGYTLGIARNLANRHFTRGPQRREVAFDDGAVARLEARLGPARAPCEPDPRELRERMTDALNGLLATEPLEARALVELHYREGRTSAEIAERLHLKPSAVRMRLKRIRDRLHGRLLALALEEQR